MNNTRTTIITLAVLGLFAYGAFFFSRNDSTQEVVSSQVANAIMSVRLECKNNCDLFEENKATDESFVITMDDTNLDGFPDSAVIDENGRKETITAGVATDKTILALWNHALSSLKK